MPNRIIRAGINRSERVNQLDAAEEVFYRRLLNEVDDHGLYDARPAILRSTLFPLRVDRVREADISRWMAACQKAGLIVLYEAGGKPYLKVLDTRWKARSEPKFPLPPKDPPNINNGSQLHAGDNNCKQLRAGDNSPPQLLPNTKSETNTETNTTREVVGSFPLEEPSPSQRLGERLQDFFPALATNRPQLEGVFSALQARSWTASTLDAWQGWYREKWPRSQMSHFNLLNTLNDYDEIRGRQVEKRQYCGKCNYGWLPPADGEDRARRCVCNPEVSH